MAGKVFYVLRQKARGSDAVNYVCTDIGAASWQRFENVNNATQFFSVGELLGALQALVKHRAEVQYRGRGHSDWGSTLEIVRVQEKTPGTTTEQRRVLNDCEGCKPGETVRWASQDLYNSLSSDGFLNRPVTWGEVSTTTDWHRWTKNLNEAHLFDSALEVVNLHARENNAATKGTPVRVAVSQVPTQPTFNLTVLS